MAAPLRLPGVYCFAPPPPSAHLLSSLLAPYRGRRQGSSDAATLLAVVDGPVAVGSSRIPVGPQAAYMLRRIVPCLHTVAEQRE